MLKLSLLAVVSTACFWSPEAASGGMIAAYNFGTPTGNPLGTTFIPSAVSSDTDANSIASDLFDGDGSLNFSSAAESASEVPSVFKSYLDIPSVFDFSTSTAYFGFSVAPIPGMALNLTSLTFDAHKDIVTGNPSTGNASTTHITFALLSSDDGFTSFQQHAVDPTQLTNNSGTWSAFLGNNLALQNVTQSIGFRLYLHDVGNTSTAGFHLDNVCLDGSSATIGSNDIVTPEPSSAMLLAVGALGSAAGWRRRRHRPSSEAA